MAIPTRSHLTLMALSLGLSFGAVAEDHKAAADSAATSATKPAATAKATSLSTSTATAKSEVAPAGEKAPELSADKHGGDKSTSAKKPEQKAERAAPEHIMERPGRISVATRRVALAAVAAKAAEAKAAEKPEAEAHAAHPLHWSYEGETGPQAWAKLAPEFASCGAGQRQSPIDIRDGMKVELEPIAFEYRPSSFKVTDNGHFHRPSEEMIDGKQFEMVVHMVHQDSQGKLAVVAVLVDVGARQPVIQTVLNNLPLEKNSDIAVTSNSLDMNQMLPGDRRYFTYMGSLTTPPCTEDVLWIVMKQPVQATVEQLNLFSRIYPMNARPIQATAGRVIKESN